MAEKKFNGRVLTSLIVTCAFVVMALSGVIAYIMPHGRIAYWTDWHFWGLTKTQWANMHIIASLLFLVVGGFHIYFNWTPLKKYFVGKLAGSLRFGRELALAVVLTLAICLSGVLPYAPFSLVFDFNDYVKAAWVSGPDQEPPFGHAEELALSVFCKKTRIPLDQAMDAMREKGIKIDNAKQSFGDIAKANGTTPAELFVVIKHLEKKTVVKAAKFTPQSVEEAFAGSGIGRKTLPEVAEMSGQSLELIQARLAALGYKVDLDEPLKQAADSLDLSPLELLKAMLVEGYQPR